MPKVVETRHALSLRVPNLHFHILFCPTEHAGYKERARNNFPNYASQLQAIFAQSEIGTKVEGILPKP